MGVRGRLYALDRERVAHLRLERLDHGVPDPVGVARTRRPGTSCSPLKVVSRVVTCFPVALTGRASARATSSARTTTASKRPEFKALTPAVSVGRSEKGDRIPAQVTLLLHHDRPAPLTDPPFSRPRSRFFLRTEDPPSIGPAQKRLAGTNVLELLLFYGGIR